MKDTGDGNGVKKSLTTANVQELRKRGGPWASTESQVRLGMVEEEEEAEEEKAKGEGK